jgi:voltage-gated potassium channel
MARDRAEAFERFSRAVDGPLTVLALVMVPLIVLPLVVDLSPGTESAFLAIDYLIWAVFAAEYAIKLYLAPNRRKFVAHHIADLIIVLVPILRPLRVLRSVRLLRLLRLALLAGLAAKGLREARNVLRHRGLSWVLLIILVLNLIAAAMVLEFERGYPEANIDSYADALWWAVTTITTVGYGDRFPMSSAGRGVAVALMIAGIAHVWGDHRDDRRLLRRAEGRGGHGWPAGSDHGAARPHRDSTTQRGQAAPRAGAPLTSYVPTRMATIAGLMSARQLPGSALFVWDEEDHRQALARVRLRLAPSRRRRT